MKQQSEHLSNAQIEQYGKRASGAGPETEAWVETHLDDCPSCRSRVLDFQRTRFALLPDPKVNKASTSDCSSEDDLRNLAAGLYPDPKAAQLKAHAATCNRCGPLLQEYMEDFSDESSPEEQAFLDRLRTASPEWRQQKAREMFKQEVLKKNRVTPEPIPAIDLRKFFSWKWIMVPALPAVALIAVGIWYLQRDTPEKAERYLAEAYTEQRTVEMRVPDASYADFNERRSGQSESPLNSPASLTQANVLISGHLKKNPGNPQWLMLSARFDLLGWNPRSALNTLDQISDPQFTVSPEYLMTKAMALYERAEISKESQDYHVAVDFLSQALQKTPNDPVLLFNQAVACEKILAPVCAIEDWSRFLQVEKDPRWLAEGRKHLDKLQEKKNPAP